MDTEQTVSAFHRCLDREGPDAEWTAPEGRNLRKKDGPLRFLWRPGCDREAESQPLEADHVVGGFSIGARSGAFDRSQFRAPSPRSQFALALGKFKNEPQGGRLGGQGIRKLLLRGKPAVWEGSGKLYGARGRSYGRLST